MIIKQLTKKVLITTAMASSLFILPQFATHHASAATATINTIHQTLSVGRAGSAVTSLQTRLKELGFYNYTIDGVYGSRTKSAVMSYQKANHLTADGIAGPITLAKLFSASSATSTISSVSTSSSAIASRIISEAEALQGIKYVYGGTTTSGFDCSGFTQYVFEKNGITLPRTAAQQMAAGSPTSLVPGALVFFSTVSAGPSHVGIYIGNNEFISATSSSGIAIESMSSSYWGPRYIGARTFLK